MRILKQKKFFGNRNSHLDATEVAISGLEVNVNITQSVCILYRILHGRIELVYMDIRITTK